MHGSAIRRELRGVDRCVVPVRRPPWSTIRISSPPMKRRPESSTRRGCARRRRRAASRPAGPPVVPESDQAELFAAPAQGDEPAAEAEAEAEVEAGRGRGRPDRGRGGRGRSRRSSGDEAADAPEPTHLGARVPGPGGPTATTAAPLPPSDPGRDDRRLLRRAGARGHPGGRRRPRCPSRRCSSPRTRPRPCGAAGARQWSCRRACRRRRADRRCRGSELPSGSRRASARQRTERDQDADADDRGPRGRARRPRRRP